MAILDKYYNRYNANKKYTKSLFLASRGLQSAELNEIQEYASQAIRGIGDALFADGDVISGCTCVVDSQTGAVTVEAGKVYLRGLVRDIHEGNFTIPTDCSVRVGVYFKEQTITELEDETLRDPAVGTRNFQEVGAARTQYITTWGYQAEGVTELNSDLGEFYTIYNVENGVLVQKALAPQMDSVSTALARYDNESNGSYVVKGMNVTCLSSKDGEQVFTINEGKAHIKGYEVELNHSLRSRFEDDFDINIVRSDRYIFDPDAMGKMMIKLSYQPLHEIISVDITVQKTTKLTRRLDSSDPLPDSPIEEIVQVKQDTTIYTRGVDYKLTAGHVDWSLSGSKPASGSSYEVIYKYNTQFTPEKITDSGFEVSGAVTGSTILVSYSWKMPRYDLITIDAEGIIRRVKGLAHPWSPTIPKAPAGQLVLAQVYQGWSANGLPTVTNNAIRVVQMSDIEGMRNTINDLYYLVAQLQLKNDANAADPTAKKGIFVDPFYDDDMRDKGIEQTGAIVDNKLTLPIDFSLTGHAKKQEVYMLPYELEPVITQEAQTGSMKVNPYDAFDPMPADVEITLNVDFWTDIVTEWLSPITQSYSQYVYGRHYGSSISTGNQLINSNKKNAEYMRQLTQKFKIEGMRPGESITSMTFDSVEITPEELTEDDKKDEETSDTSDNVQTSGTTDNGGMFRRGRTRY